MGDSLEPSFTGSVSKLAFSTATIQILSIAAIPVTSRLFKPEAFGSLSFFVSIATIVASVSSLKYNLAVVLPKDDEEASHVFAVGGLLTVLTTLLSVFVLLVMGEFILRKGGVPELIPVVWLFPFYIFFLGFANLLQYWHMRIKSYGTVAVARIAGKTSYLVAAISFGLGGLSGAVYLVFSAVFLPAVQAGLYSVSCFSSFFTFFKHRCTLSGLKKAAVKHWKFPLYQAWSDLLIGSSQSLSFILITAFYGTESNGQFSRALALVSIPLFFLSSSIRDVLYQRASSMKASGKAYVELFDNLLLRLISFIVPPMMILFFISTDLFVFVAGDNWLEAGIFTRYLVPWLTVRFISSPTSVLFSIEALQDRQLAFNIMRISLWTVVLVGCGLLHISIHSTILLYGAVGMAMECLVIVFLLKKIGLTVSGLLKTAGSASLMAMPLVLLITVAKWAFDLSTLYVLSIASLSYAALLAWSTFRDPEMKLVLKRMFRMV